MTGATWTASGMALVSNVNGSRLASAFITWTDGLFPQPDKNKVEAKQVAANATIHFFIFRFFFL